MSLTYLCFLICNMRMRIILFKSQRADMNVKYINPYENALKIIKYYTYISNVANNVISVIFVKNGILSQSTYPRVQLLI